jgi:MFS family permease
MPRRAPPPTARTRAKATGSATPRATGICRSSSWPWCCSRVANAPLAPLASSRLAYEHSQVPLLMTAGVVVVPELVAALIAVWVAARADEWGRKPLLVLGLAAVSLRATLLGLSANPWALLLFQALDGMSAAVIGVMLPLVIADLTRGTGRYNLAQGVAGTAMGLGAAVSVGVAGYAVQHFGYWAGFLGLAAVALIGIAILVSLFPEPKAGASRKWARLIRVPKLSRSQS